MTRWMHGNGNKSQWAGRKTPNLGQKPWKNGYQHRNAAEIGWFESSCLQFGYSACFHMKLSYQCLIGKGTPRLIRHIDGLITIPAQTPGGWEPCHEIKGSSTFGDLAVRGVEEFAEWKLKVSHFWIATSTISHFISVARSLFFVILVSGHAWFHLHSNRHPLPGPILNYWITIHHPESLEFTKSPSYWSPSKQDLACPHMWSSMTHIQPTVQVSVHFIQLPVHPTTLR